MTVSVPLDLRSEVRPGDVGAVAELHGREYWNHYGLDARFEAGVAQGLARFVAAVSEDPDSGRIWLAEDDQGLVGCIAITRERPDHGRVRWFIVAERARGQGLGRRLLDEALAYARERFSSLELDTFSELTTAGAMYRAAGFECVSSVPFSDWGREIQLQRYELRIGQDPQ